MLNETTIAVFLSILPADRKDRAERALRILANAEARGSIFNVEFKDAKLTLDRSIEQAWDYGRGTLLAPLPIGDAFWSPEATALREVVHAVSCSYVRDAIASTKKLAKTKVEHPWIETARAFFAKVLPVAESMESLRASIVKGRRPPTAEQIKAREAKLANVKSMPRATCGCCFADQAVLPNGLIHDHGYSLPREWMKTASCYGRQFRPLEVSDEGPKFMVALLTRTEAAMVKGIANLKKATKLSAQRGRERNAHGERIPKMVEFEVGHPEFEHVRNAQIAGAESNLRVCRRDLAQFQKVVAEWKPAAR